MIEVLSEVNMFVAFGSSKLLGNLTLGLEAMSAHFQLTFLRAMISVPVKHELKIEVLCSI